MFENFHTGQHFQRVGTEKIQDKHLLSPSYETTSNLPLSRSQFVFFNGGSGQNVNKFDCTINDQILE